jgi:small subunit ribosomal protein S8
MLTDPIADMLTRVRNANTAMHDEVRMPSSKQKVALADVLQREGYIGGYEVAPSPKGVGDVLTIQMKYSKVATSPSRVPRASCRARCRPASA